MSLSSRHFIPLMWLAAAALPAAPALSATLDSARQRQLDHLLVQDCGSCHGLRLTGGLGPALTTAALDGKSRDYLIATVTHGHDGTAMPSWKPLLNEQEIAWLVDRLLQGNTP